MNRIIGFIGGGNMCGAIVGGLLNAGLTEAGKIIVSDRYQAGLDAMRQKYGVRITQDNRAAAAESDILVLSVKPNVYAEVIAEICGSVRENTVVVTIAAGQPLAVTGQRFGGNVKIVRVMPNTPALVGEGMAAICANELVSGAELAEITEIFRSFGKAELVPERLFDVVTAVSGSSPAYVYLFIEALADAAVAGGMPRAQAYTFCAQAVLGSAKMVLDTGRHPGELKDMVCSPGGTTIDAVMELEKSGLRGCVQQAAMTCLKKSQEMSR